MQTLFAEDLITQRILQLLESHVGYMELMQALNMKLVALSPDSIATAMSSSCLYLNWTKFGNARQV